MKKIFLVIIPFVLFSCAEPTQTFTPKQGENVTNWYDAQTEEYTGVYRYVYKSTYNGHDYLMFGDGNRSSVVHDPDCEKCKQ